MNLQEAKTLKAGDYIHTPKKFNADGTPMWARFIPGRKKLVFTDTKGKIQSLKVKA